MVNLVRVFWGPNDQKCPLRILLRFVVWGSKKLFLGVLTKIKFFFCKLLTMANILRIQKKISKNLIFWWNWVVRVKSFFSQEKEKHCLLSSTVNLTPPLKKRWPKTLPSAGTRSRASVSSVLFFWKMLKILS